MNPKIQMYYIDSICLCNEVFKERIKYLQHSSDCKVMRAYRGEMSHSYVNDTKVLQKLANDATGAVEARDHTIEQLQNQIEELKKKK